MCTVIGALNQKRAFYKIFPLFSVGKYDVDLVLERQIYSSNRFYIVSIFLEIRKHIFATTMYLGYFLKEQLHFKFKFSGWNLYYKCSHHLYCMNKYVGSFDAFIITLPKANICIIILTISDYVLYIFIFTNFHILLLNSDYI